MPKNVAKYSAQYELTLANIIISTAPYAPHFTSELWSKFISIPNRVNQADDLVLWDKDVLEQKWPQLDKDYEVTFSITVSSKVLKKISLFIAIQNLFLFF